MFLSCCTTYSGNEKADLKCCSSFEFEPAQNEMQRHILSLSFDSQPLHHFYSSHYLHTNKQRKLSCASSLASERRNRALTLRSKPSKLRAQNRTRDLARTTLVHKLRPQDLGSSCARTTSHSDNHPMSLSLTSTSAEAAPSRDSQCPCTSALARAASASRT